jgi:Ribonuclease G/E
MYTVLALPGSLRGSKEVTTSIYQGRDTRVEEGQQAAHVED